MNLNDTDYYLTHYSNHEQHVESGQGGQSFNGRVHGFYGGAATGFGTGTTPKNQVKALDDIFDNSTTKARSGPL